MTEAFFNETNFHKTYEIYDVYHNIKIYVIPYYVYTNKRKHERARRSYTSITLIPLLVHSFRFAFSCRIAAVVKCTKLRLLSVKRNELEVQ